MDQNDDTQPFFFTVTVNKTCMMDRFALYSMAKCFYWALSPSLNVWPWINKCVLNWSKSTGIKQIVNASSNLKWSLWNEAVCAQWIRECAHIKRNPVLALWEAWALNSITMTCRFIYPCFIVGMHFFSPGFFKQKCQTFDCSSFPSVRICWISLSSHNFKLSIFGFSTAGSTKLDNLMTRTWALGNCGGRFSFFLMFYRLND